MEKTLNVQLTGIKEIARRSGVSIGTVDRVIHNRLGVSKKTREKVNKIIKELNYKPNILARRLASRKVLHFAVLIPEVSKETDYWQAPLVGIKRASAEIQQFGIEVQYYFFDQNNKDSFVQKTEEMLENKIDGILLAPSFIHESIAFIKICKGKNIPYVFINSDIPKTDSLCYIGPDLYQSGYLGAKLIDTSTGDDDKILIVNISREIDQYHHLLRKEQGFRAYFKDKGRNNEVVKLDIRQTDYESIKKSIRHVLTQQKDVKAIFVTNSRVFTVAKCLEETGKKGYCWLGIILWIRM